MTWIRYNSNIEKTRLYLQTATNCAKEGLASWAAVLGVESANIVVDDVLDQLLFATDLLRLTVRRRNIT